MSIIIKFGAKNHLEELLTDGVLHMQRLDYFKREEEELPLRYDRWEGADHVIQPGRGHITIDGRRFELAGPGLLWCGGPPLPHVFCAYALTVQRARLAKERGASVVDRNNARWGTHALVILDVPTFLRRAGDAFRKLSLGYSEGLVDYVPEDFAGELGPLRKREQFRFQSEFRFAVHGHSDEVLRVEIGSLNDIATLVDAESAVSLDVVFRDE